jgi:transcriptional regulator with XRE-family HTH domain
VAKKKGRPSMPALVIQLQDALREAQDRGQSLSDLWRRSGVTQGQLSRFLRGERMLSLPAAGKLCEALGLRLVGPEGPSGETPTPARPGRPEPRRPPRRKGA